MGIVAGIHFDSNIFIRAAADNAVHETLRAVVSHAQELRLRVAYSPVIAIEVLSGAKVGHGVSVDRVQSRLQALVEACGDDILPAPAEVTLGVVKGIHSSRCKGDSKLASLVRAGASGDKNAIRMLGKRADAAKRFVRDEFVRWVERMRPRISAQGDLQEQLGFLRGPLWAHNFYSDLAARAGISLQTAASTRETGLPAMDGNFAAYTRLLEDMARYGDFNAEKHRNDSEDIQLLVYAACGLALVTYDQRIARWVAGCSQADMVWHFDKALERLNALP